MIEYCLGFMFSPLQGFVVLIEKAKPAWMAGKLNGVGGKVEPGETPYAAMAREFWEETGVHHKEWTFAGQYRMADALCHIYLTYSKSYDCVRTTTREPVSYYAVESLAGRELVPNLRWLIPFLLDFDSSGANSVIATYGGTHTNARRDTPACAA